MVTGEKYIGFASNFRKRKNEHKYDSFHINSDDYYSCFHKAIREYGWNNFSWEVIYQSLDRDHCLKVMENHFIVEHRTFTGFSDCNGYNSTLGGEGCFGYKHTEEHKEYLRIRYTGENNPMYGKSYVRDDEHRMYMSLLLTGIKKSPEHIQKRVATVSRDWILIDPNGNQLQIKNLKEFCRQNSLNQSSMGKVASGKQTNHKGWKCVKLT